MEEKEIELTIEELAEHVGVPVRTVRFYISEGLLPGPGARGKAATYGNEHLLRLRLVRLLAEQRVPLAEIGSRLAPLSLSEVRALLVDEGHWAAEREQAARQPSPKEYVSALLRQARAAPPALAAGELRAKRLLREPSGPAELLCDAPARYLVASSSPQPQAEAWQRWELAPGVELLVRADAAELQRPLIERVLQVVRQFLVRRQGGEP